MLQLLDSNVHGIPEEPFDVFKKQYEKRGIRIFSLDFFDKEIQENCTEM